MSEIRQELEALLKDAGIGLGVRLFSELSPYMEFRDLIVVRVRGDCRIDARPATRPETGALAFAHTSDGHVLPFMEVFCERVRTSVRSALWGDQIRRADEYLGRGLARVMAHEMYHILGKTCKHSGSGLAKHALTGQQLIADRFAFDPEDLERIISGGN